MMAVPDETQGPRGRAVLALVALGVALSAGALSLVVPVMALDLEGVVYNYYLDWTTDYAQVWYARADWIGPMRAALWLGVPPMVTLAVCALLLRLGERVSSGLDPLPVLAPRVRRVVGAVVFGGFALAAVPLGLVLSTQLGLELMGWVEWYGHVDPTMEQVHAIGHRVITPVLWLGGLVTVLWSLAPRGSRWRMPLRVRRLSSTPGILVLLTLGVLVGSLVSLTSLRATRAAGTGDGRAVHREQCGECHESALPLYFVKTPGEWQATVDTHRRIEKLSIDDANAEDLHAFLAGMRAFDDAWTFRTRCQNCHGSSWRRWEERPAEDWAAIAERMARWSPYFYSGEVRDQLVRHVSGSKGVETARLGLPAGDWERYQRIGQECDDCHSIGYEAERYLKTSREETRDMVARMSQKMAKPYTDVRIESATDDWLEVVGDDDLFARLYPHDNPEDTGGGL